MIFLIQKNEKSRGEVSLADNMQVLLLGQDGKKAYPIYENPAMTATTYVEPKVVLFMEKKRE